jgi:nitroreductase
VETYDAIMTRRSSPLTSDRLPERELIERLLDAAVRAPTHHVTEPWRFVVLAGDARRELGEAWARGDAARGRTPDAARAKVLRAPVIVCVIARPKIDHPKVVEVEEHHAIGAALQNILLAAHDAGLAAMLRTGPAAAMPEVRSYLGVRSSESIAGFVYVGYPAPGDGDRPRSRRTDATDLTEWRGWPSA